MGSEKKSGCLVPLGGGCLVIILILFVAAAVGGYLFLGKFEAFVEKIRPFISDTGKVVEAGKKFALEKGVDFSVGQFQVQLREYDYSDVEQAAIMAPVRELSDRIKRGDVSLDKGMLILQAIIGGKVGAELNTKSWEKNFLQSALLSQAEKEKGKRLINRYLFAREANKIPAELKAPIESLTRKEEINNKGEKSSKLRDDLSSSQVKDLLQLLEIAVTKAKIEDKVTKVDIGQEIREIMAKELPSPAPSLAAAN